MRAAMPFRLSKPVLSAACGITAHAFVEAPLSQIGLLRDRPGPEGSPALPARFLRHCDEQTVVAMQAVLAAIASLPPDRRDCSRHGVVAASCQAGRLATAVSLAKLRPHGAVSVSPHIVPQCSLHAVAGAVSVALGMHGPNVGIGGGPDALAEGLFTAVSFLQPGGGAEADGVWLIATDWADEPALDATGAALGDPTCRGLALFVEPAAAASLAIAVHVPDAPTARPRIAEITDPLGDFARAVAMCATGGVLASWTVECPWSAEIRLTRHAGQAARAAVGREAA
jgi:hypothetical protein